jgi:hypothetical protein
MAAGATYEPIATQTLGTAVTTITFSSIPATYTDLRLVLNVPTTSVARSVYVRLNSDTGTNYSGTYLQGNGATATSARTTSAAQIEFGNATSTTLPSLFTADIFSYAGSTFKTLLASAATDRNGTGVTDNRVQLWRSTSAITTILLLLSSTGNFDIGTTATLYGIKAA